MALVILSIIPRLILELWAITKAPKLSKKYLEEKNIEKDNINKVERVYNFSTKILTPFALIQMFFFKIVRLIVITVITFLKF